MNSLWRLRKFLHPYRLQVAPTFLALLAIVASRLVIPAIVRQAIDGGLLQGEVRYLLTSAAVILGICLARALLLDPRILVLDDSTSSVDNQTEKLIEQALDRLMESRTTFVISQRLSTISRADLILVLDQGRIVGRGTHNQLLVRDGLYRQIYELQLCGQESPVSGL